jgi:acetoin utilization protein AcuC
VTASARPLYIGSEIYRHSTYGLGHPLAIPRVSTCTDLCRALGWLPDTQYRDSPIATLPQLARFHDLAYLSALQDAEATQTVSDAVRLRHAIGAQNNPLYREVFTRPATSAGGVLLAAALTSNRGVVHCPGGGTHHGRADRAAGFCYLNDCVLGLLAWLDQGLTRIAYLDLDAHHGDGVQDAFANDDRVLTISLHEAQRWPHTGAAEDRAGGQARNLPLPRACNDSEYAWLLNQAVWPLIARFNPQALMLQCGADALEEDPLAKLSLSNTAIWSAVAHAHQTAERLIVLGGGGYNPYTVARCWAGIWATLNHLPIPDRLPNLAEAILRRLRYSRAAGRNPPEHWFTTLRDVAREGPIRAEIHHLAAATLA